MNPFDMVIVVILSYCIIRGAFRGVIREVASIAAVLGGFYAAFMHHDALAPLLSGWIQNMHYLYITSFLVLFCAVFLAVTLAGVLIRTLLKLMLLGVIDRVLGSVFGALKAVIVISLLFFLLITFLPEGGARMVRDSVVAPHINAIASGIARVIPQEAREAVDRRIRDLKTQWEKNQTGS
ncbi:MAG: CvpA family protein [Desulfosalsimonas sp.]|uniref:CvpA family protein n=1 Tax=Desulfosalsimonas sp. TaxID=3073848 RepID=UPI0039709BF7